MYSSSFLARREGIEIPISVLCLFLFVYQPPQEESLSSVLFSLSILPLRLRERVARPAEPARARLRPAVSLGQHL